MLEDEGRPVWQEGSAHRETAETVVGGISSGQVVQGLIRPRDGFHGEPWRAETLKV